MIEIIELPSFVRATKKWLTEAERLALHHQLKQQPESGDVISKTGGARKLRVATGGKGKRGGGRAIYYYLERDGEIFLITAYQKSKKEDISADEKKIIRLVVEELKDIGGE